MKACKSLKKKDFVNKQASRIKRTLSKPADTNLHCICESTQIQLDWIFCEFSQTQMYGIFVNAHRSQFRGRSVKACRSKFNRFCDCHQTQISEFFSIPINPNSWHISECRQIQLNGTFCKYSQTKI